MNITSNVNSTAYTEKPIQSLGAKKSYEISAEQVEKTVENHKKISTYFAELRDINLDEYKELKAKGDRGEVLSSVEFQEMIMFMDTPEYKDQLRAEKLEHGDKRDIAKIITIGEDKITVSYKGWITAPNKYGSYVSNTGNAQDTLNNLYAAFGKNNMTEEVFA